MLELSKHNPETLEEAIELIVGSLEFDEIDYIKREGAESLHFTAGTAIRNVWLRDGSSTGRAKRLAEHFRSRFKLGHADDMSGLILAGVDARVRGSSCFMPEALVNACKEHWRDLGIDPLTLKEKTHPQDRRIGVEFDERYLVVSDDEDDNTASY